MGGEGRAREGVRNDMFRPYTIESFRDVKQPDGNFLKTGLVTDNI